MEKIKKIIFGILSTLLVIILVFNVYNFICIKVLGHDLATINGYAMLEVVSGSMEPTIHKGDMIIIDTKARYYKDKDIITFYDKEGSFVTHRILSIDLDNGTMVTKGDNNNTKDAASSLTNVVGKYVTKLTGIGILLASFKNPFTMVMIFIIGLLACILLSTDKDGNPILDSDELEFKKFLEEKEKREVKEKNNTSKKKTK